MSYENRKDRKHLTLSQRIIIEKGLENNESFSERLISILKIKDTSS